MAKSHRKAVALGVLSAVWLIGAPVLGHFYWREALWVLVLLFAALAELALLSLLLAASTLHDPNRRWDLPPNPAEPPRGWRALVARLGQAVRQVRQFPSQLLMRRPGKT